MRNKGMNSAVQFNQFLPSPIPVLVVDDDQSVLDVTRLVLSRFRFEGIPISVIEASSAAAARQILAAREDIAVILLDVVMEQDDAGLVLVEHIRKVSNNQRIRIILRTGQAGFAPEYRVVQNYDINDYLAKSDSTRERLFVSLTTALRGYRDILTAEYFAGRVVQVEQEREVAAKASQAKTQFLAHMSHEIRNPLSGIIGIVELLEGDSDTEAKASLLKDLSFTVQALLAVVDDVLDVAKIEAGKLQLHEEGFNIRDWLQRSMAIFSANMQRKEIEFTHIVADEVPDLLIGDAARIQQILINFLSNAYKFTNRGGMVNVSVSGCKAEERFLLRICVEDDGAGIESNRLGEIFNAYEQGSSSTSKNYGGTGLGLSLCRNLAEVMHGSVGVVSEPERGSRFWVEIPLSVVNVTPAQAAEVVDTKGLTVVVCEDDATNQKILRVILTRQGMTPHIFDNGQDMLDSGAWREADVILMDCHMPVLGGIETTELLREMGCSLPILALTAGVSDSERQRCFDAGMDSVLAKPVDFRLLDERLRAHARLGRKLEQ